MELPFPTERRSRVPLALLAAFAALFLVRLGGAGVIDYDEACYAEVSRGMHLAGEWLAPSLNGEPFFEKPPLLYWTQILGYRLLGIGEWGARVGNALAALATLAAVFAFARRPLGERGAAIATVSLGTSLEFFALARVALTDTLLTLFLALSLGLFHRARMRFAADGGGHGLFWLACAAGGVAVLAKGIVAVAILAATAGTLQVIERRSRPLLSPLWILPGALILISIGGSWPIALGFTHERGFAFLDELLREHTIGRFAEPMQGHSGPFFYYLPVLALGFLPWTPFAALALRRALRGDIGRDPGGEERAAFVRLFLIAGGWALLGFSIAATKLPNYIAPCLPALAIAVGESWDARWGNAPSRGDRRAAAWSAGLLLALALLFAALPAALAALPRLLGEAAEKLPALAAPLALGAWSALAAGALALAGIGAWRRRDGAPSALFAAIVPGWVLFLALLAAGLLPAADRALAEPLRAAARDAAAAAAPGESILLIGLRHRPSVSWVTGRRTEYRSRRNEAVLATLSAPPPEGSAGRVAIAFAADLERLRGFGALEVLAERSGYAVIRLGAR